MKTILILLVQIICISLSAQNKYVFDNLLYGVSYYYEYMPYERLEKDAQMMKECGISVVRIGESTWSCLEPKDGVFDFSYIDKTLDFTYPFKKGTDLLTKKPLGKDSKIKLKEWDLLIVESD
jgi:beta-galactosidase